MAGIIFATHNLGFVRSKRLVSLNYWASQLAVNMARISQSLPHTMASTVYWHEIWGHGWWQSQTTSIEHLRPSLRYQNTIITVPTTVFHVILITAWPGFFSTRPALHFRACGFIHTLIPVQWHYYCFFKLCNLGLLVLTVPITIYIHVTIYNYILELIGPDISRH